MAQPTDHRPAPRGPGATAGRPRRCGQTVLLADEPTGNLDEDTRDEIIALLEKLWQDLRLTLILVTHDSTVARRAQRVGLMRDGRLAIQPEHIRG